jgi:hypothetical protein
MATAPQECADSWRPIPHLELDLAAGRWPGDKHARIEPHSSDARAVGAASEVPGSEG